MTKTMAVTLIGTNVFAMLAFEPSLVTILNGFVAGLIAGMAFTSWIYERDQTND